MNFRLKFKWNTLTLEKRLWLFTSVFHNVPMLNHICRFNKPRNKKKEKLRLLVEEEMRVALSNVHPNIERICAKNQAQILH